MNSIDDLEQELLKAEDSESLLEIGMQLVGMLREKETKSRLASSVVTTLNDALKDDPKAIEQLIEHRVACNQQLDNHPTIQVSAEGVGMLGVINGLIGTIDEGPRKGWGLIMAVFNDDERLERFELTERI